MKGTFKLKVLADFGFQRRDVGQQVAVSQANSLRFSGRAGSENDLGQVVRVDLLILVRRRRMTLDDIDQQIEAQHRQAILEMARLHIAEQKQFSFDMSLRSIDEIRALRLIDRNRDCAAQHTDEKRRDPFRTVLAPENDAVAFAYAARFKLARELTGCPRKRLISPAPHAQAALSRDGDLARTRQSLIQ